MRLVRRTRRIWSSQLLFDEENEELEGNCEVSPKGTVL